MCWIVPSCTLNSDRGRAEETAPQRLGQHLRHDRLELGHFLRVAGCRAVRHHRALPYDIAGRFSRFVFGPLRQIHFAPHVLRERRARAAAGGQLEAAPMRDAVFPPPRPPPFALHQVQQRCRVLQLDRQRPPQPRRQEALEAETRPGVVAVFLAAPAGQHLDAIDAQRGGGRHLPVHDVQSQPAVLQMGERNMEAVVEQYEIRSIGPRGARREVMRAIAESA